MRLSLQVHYAICGIFDVAYNGQGRAVQVRVIGERQGIPVRYLEQIFQRLRRAELVQGKRGPGGGYQLARPAREITLRDVVAAVEGEFDAELGFGGDGVERAHRPEFLWGELAVSFEDLLGGVSLEEVCRRAARHAVRRATPEEHSYQI